MIGGTAWIRTQRHAVELRIEHEEILGKQSTVPDEATAFTRHAGITVQKVGESADVTVRNEGSSARVCAQCCRTGDRGADNAGSRNIESGEHPIEQRRIAASPSRIERIEETIFEDVHGVEWNSSPKPRAFGADVRGIQRESRSNLSLNLEVEVLNIRAHAVRSRASHGICAVAVEWTGLKRSKLLRYWQR